jgi:hypothetical protein
MTLFRTHSGTTYLWLANALRWLFYAVRVPLMELAVALGKGGEELTDKLKAYRQTMKEHALLFRAKNRHLIDQA